MVFSFSLKTVTSYVLCAADVHPSAIAEPLLLVRCHSH